MKTSSASEATKCSDTATGRLLLSVDLPVISKQRVSRQGRREDRTLLFGDLRRAGQLAISSEVKPDEPTLATVYQTAALRLCEGRVSE